MADELKRAFDYLISKGLQPHQAAAMAAHMMAESGGNPATVHDGGTGYGIFGFRDPTPGQGRKTGLFNYAKDRPWVDPHSMEGQLDYALHELDTTEKAAGEKLYGARTYQEAIDAGMHYERPAGYTPDNPAAGHNYVGRFNYGAELAGVQPMVGPAMAAAGGTQAVQPTAGLLAGLPVPPAPAGANDPDINVRTRTADDEIAGWSKYGDKGGLLSAGQAAAIGSAGKDMVAANAPREQPWQNLQANIHQPREMAALPDFTQQLAQLRLKRRPWETQ